MVFFVLPFIDLSLIFMLNSKIFMPIKFILSLLFPRHFPHTSLERIFTPVFHVWIEHVAQLGKGRREMRGRLGDKIVLRGCERNYSGVKFIPPIPGPKQIPSRYPCPVGDWVDKLPISYVITTTQLRFQSDC